VRIISGEHKGRRISGAGRTRIRPTSDRVKESIFNVLGEGIEGKRILDLFAGTGSLGLEALSRGADCVTFVDSSAQSLDILRKNLDSLDVSFRSSSESGRDACPQAKATLFRLDGLRAAKKLGGRFQIIFADPPYLKGFAQKIIDSMAQSDILEKKGLLILEHHKKETFVCPEGKLILLKQKKFGDTVTSFFVKIT
jgi:16S rRNA (guanine966-N2)-methyltransferase